MFLFNYIGPRAAEIASIYYDFSATGAISSSVINFAALDLPRPPSEPLVLVTDSWFHRSSFISHLLEAGVEDTLFSFGAHENEIPGRLLPLLTYRMRRGEYRLFWNQRLRCLFTFWFTGDGKLVKNCTNRFVPEDLPRQAQKPVISDSTINSQDAELVSWLMSLPPAKLDLASKLVEKHAPTRKGNPVEVVSSLAKVAEEEVVAIKVQLEEKRSAQSANRCPICKKVGSQSSIKVECERCQGWFHFDCDTDLDVQAIETLTQDEQAPYCCPICRQKESHLEAQLSHLTPSSASERSTYDHLQGLTVKELKAECLRVGTKPSSGSKQKILDGLMNHLQLRSKLSPAGRFIEDVVLNPPRNPAKVLETGSVVLQQHKALFNGTDRITVLLYKMRWKGALKKNPLGMVIINLACLLMVNAFGEEANSVPHDQPLPHTIRAFVAEAVENWPTKVQLKQQHVAKRRRYHFS